MSGIDRRENSETPLNLPLRLELSNPPQNIKAEKRRDERIRCNLSAEIETSCIGRKQIHCKNISEGGAYIEISFHNIESPQASIACLRHENIQIGIEINNNNIKAYGFSRWNQLISKKENDTETKYGMGLEFLEISFDNKLDLKRFISNLQKDKLSPNIQLFPLLINGKEIDTKRYEYQPFVEKALTEPSYTFHTIKNLKQDKLTDDYNDFVYGKYCIGDENDFQNAILSAYQASIIYKNFDVDKRAKIIVDIHNRLLKYKKEYIDLLVIEGHSRRLAEWEVNGMLKGTDPQSVHFYRMNLEAQIGEENNEKIFLHRKPDGVVCLSTPKNAPSSISVIGIFALLAGNALIVKPPLTIPISTIYFWKDIVYKSAIQNGAPPGVVNIVIGNSEKIMNGWLSSPHVNDIIYIGDSKKGIELGKKIYASGKKPILELSGNDKSFIWKDAPIDLASDALIECFYGSSQICMVPKMAFIHQDIFDEIMESLLKKTGKLKPGLPSDPETILSPVGKINDYFKTLEDAVGNGGVLLCGGKRINHFGINDDKGHFIEPTIVKFDDCCISKNILCINEENFFPLLPVIKVSGGNDDEIFNKMIKYSEIDNFGLRISIWTTSENYIDKFSKNIMPGGILRINSSHIGFSLFLSNNGGTGLSGGPFGEMTYIWQKTTHLQGISITSL